MSSLDLLSKVTGVTGFSTVSASESLPVIDNTFVIVKEALSASDKVEKNKDKLNLAHGVGFVSKNHHSYIGALASIFDRTPSEYAFEWGRRISFNGESDFAAPQISPENIKELLSRMPRSLIELSKLNNVNYHLFNGGAHLLPVPIFNEDGSFSGGADAISLGDFPRKKGKTYTVYGWVKGDNGWEFISSSKESLEDDHPSRVLVGVSNGTTIFPTPIPSTVSPDREAIYLYQIHVLLHEFFHTIDYPRRKPQDRENILLEADGEQFTFQEWWEAFEELVLSGLEPECISSYADTYIDVLIKENKERELKEPDYTGFTRALAEQICETFVAYQLNIISNNSGWTDFRSHSFGNTKQLSEFIKGESPAANLKWILMDKLCRARVLKKD